MIVTFTVPGEPQGKGRPRYVRRTGRAYTPDKTVAYEELVRQRFLEVSNGERFPDDAQISARISAFFPIPKSTSKKKVEKMLLPIGTIRPTKKPDADNIAKIILDSLNGIAFKDDSQVVTLVVTKRYSVAPFVNVILWDKEDDDG